MQEPKPRRSTATGPWAGALLRFCWQGVRAHIAEAATTAGYEDLSGAHLALFRYPTLDGARPTKLAQEVLLSKQAVNDLLGDLETGGYIRREVDPEDKRNRIIRLTDKGTELEEVLRKAARDADRLIQQEMGLVEFENFRANLVRIAELWRTHLGQV